MEARAEKERQKSATRNFLPAILLAAKQRAEDARNRK